MVNFPYRCPATGYRLEGRQPAPAAPSPMITYVAEHCPACGGVHIVNPATGKLLSEERMKGRQTVLSPPVTSFRRTQQQATTSS